MRQGQALFIQIAETIKDRILSGSYVAEERIPSARDFAVEMEVNPNTVMRAFEILQSDNIIYNKRGIGYFTSPEAREKILSERKKRMQEVVLPALIGEMKGLGISLGEAQDLLSHHWGL